MTDPDLLFCRACGGSVARRELLAGRALLVEGRAWCPACAPGMLSRRTSLRWALAGAVLAAGGLGGWALGRALGESGEAARRADRAASAAAAAAERLDRVEARLPSLEAGTKGLAALLETRGRSQDALEDRLEGVERSLTTLLGQVESLRREVVSARGPAGPTPEEEAALLARLDDPNSGKRFEAIWRLQRGKGEAARRAAVRGLADADDSVRYQAALLAGDLRVKEAVPVLVERLSDPSAAVRAAASDALRAIEGTDLGFDPLEPDGAKREEAVLRWRERVRGR